MDAVMGAKARVSPKESCAWDSFVKEEIHHALIERPVRSTGVFVQVDGDPLCRTFGKHRLCPSWLMLAPREERRAFAMGNRLYRRPGWCLRFCRHCNQ